ncbi:MAG: hypothetical protein K8S23_13740 [Candidatus Cloacimonetes bacterium]|nr:hypothetical protein [Candidatus Cloacimonadota bacterium]
MKFSRFIFTFLFLVILVSCTSTLKTQKQQFVLIDQKILSCDYNGAATDLENAKETYYKKKDQVVYYLDLGMLYHYGKQFEKSNEMLTKAENAISELYTKSVSRAVTSMLLNDNVLEYSGEDYEDIYLNLFKALNYLELKKFDDAFVEIRRIDEKLKLLNGKYNKLTDKFNLSKDKKSDFKAGKNKFHNSALARYFSLLLYRAENKWDDVYIDYKKMEEAWNNQSQIYDYVMPNLKKSLKKTKKAKLNIFSFTGRCPDKKAKTLYIHTEKNSIIIGTTDENPKGKATLETLNVFPWKDVKKGYHFKFQVPYMKNRDSSVKYVKVKIDNEEVKTLQKIEDISKVAFETYKVKEPITYLKTITRAVIKGLFAEKRKEEMEAKIQNPLLGFAARMATDLAMDATENADLRISRYFPSIALTEEFLIESGIHTVKIEYYGINNTLLHIDEKTDVEVIQGKLNLMESFYLN